ncbi:hypothetical protein JCM9957A_18240 [Kineosporia succinea]
MLWVVGGLPAVVLLIVTGTVGTFMAYGSGTIDRTVRSTGNDAYWLGHAWVDGRRTQADVDALAAQLEGTGIRDLYVHAGPYADDGTLDAAKRPKASWFIEAVHTAIPGVRVQAWLGNKLGDDRLDLSSEQSRANVLAGVDSVLAGGFDGVHFDFEPSKDGNEDVLRVFEATHAKTQAAGRLLSVATPPVDPLPGAHLLAGLVPTQSQWSTGYLRRVAQTVDQIAIMSYDTALPSERAYRGYVRRQTEVALDVVPPDVTLIIGAPAYHDRKLVRYDFAETVAAAIGGVQLARPDRPVGVALYVDFDATTGDWDAFRRDWSPGQP